jgi:error-prone DNA polymerase
VQVQLALDLVEPDALVSGLPEMDPGERVRAEVEVLGMDVSSHIMSFYAAMLADIAVVRARDLLDCRSQSEVLVAGVKVATQTPPVRSGRRVVFLTVDDSTGPVDATFFEDVQGSYAATLFHSWLLLVRGRIRRTGRRGISLRATGCWELGAIWQLWRESGATGVHRLLAESPAPAAAAPGGGGSARERPHGTGAGGMGQRRRVLVHASGFRMSPYADTKPAGQDVKSARPRPAPTGDQPAPAKLWHSSPGSSGW